MICFANDLCLLEEITSFLKLSGTRQSPRYSPPPMPVQIRPMRRRGLNHFVTTGYAEGRTVSFDGLEYIASYGDLINAFP